MLVRRKITKGIRKKKSIFKVQKESGVFCCVVATAAWWSKGASAAKLHLMLKGHAILKGYPVYFQRIFSYFISLVTASLHC